MLIVKKWVLLKGLVVECMRCPGCISASTKRE